MSTDNKLHIEVWSDVVCPFCFIGKKHYEQALAQFEHADDVVLEWKSYQLDPEFVQPEERYDLEQGLAKKYNKPVEAIHAMQQQIANTAKESGLDFDFSKAVTFNTFQAHRVLHKAKEKGLGDKAKEAFFSDYFEKGQDLGNTDVLKAEALRIGLTEEDFQDAINNDDYAYKVKQDIQEAYELGVTGVPFFVFDRKYAVSGAQPSDAFLNTLKASYDEWKTKQKTTPFINVSEQGASCDINGNCD